MSALMAGTNNEKPCLKLYVWRMFVAGEQSFRSTRLTFPVNIANPANPADTAQTTCRSGKLDTEQDEPIVEQPRLRS
jgi:hypothetical protein